MPYVLANEESMYTQVQSEHESPEEARSSMAGITLILTLATAFFGYKWSTQDSQENANWGYLAIVLGFGACCLGGTTIHAYINRDRDVPSKGQSLHPCA